VRVSGGLSVATLFGSAIGLAILAMAGADSIILVVLAAVVIGSGSVLAHRLPHRRRGPRRGDAPGRQTTQRLTVLVEHVPAAVYIDLADPDVSDGGRLAI
jgi:hypothetical protein